METPDTNENTARHIVLRQAVKDGPVFIVGGWPERTTIREAFIDGNLFRRLGADMVVVSPTNGEAEYRIVTDSVTGAIEGSGDDLLALELMPGSIYEPEPTMIDPVDVLAQYDVPAPSSPPPGNDGTPAEAPKLPQEPLLEGDTNGPTKAEVLDAIAKITGAGAQDVALAPGPTELAKAPIELIEGEPATDAVTGLVTAPVTALPGIPADDVLEEATDESLVILMAAHLSDPRAESRAAAIDLLKAKRDAAPVMVMDVAQDGSTPGSTWNMAHQLWVMPGAAA
jgi:hypothetical protein